MKKTLLNIVIVVSFNIAVGIFTTCLFTDELVANGNKSPLKSTSSLCISPEPGIGQTSIAIFTHDRLSSKDQEPSKEKEQLCYHIISPRSFIILLLSLILYHAYRFYRIHRLEKISLNQDVRNIRCQDIIIEKRPRKKKASKKKGDN